MSIYAHVWLGHAYLQLGNHDEAIREFEIAAATGDASSSAQLAYAYAVSGRRPEAMAILRPLLTPGEGGYTPPFSIAMAYVGVGDPDAAFHWLERAYSERDPWLEFALTGMPPFEPLRADPRFAELVHRMGLTPAVRTQG